MNTAGALLSARARLFKAGLRQEPENPVQAWIC